MRIFDYACAYALLLIGMLGILSVEVWHPPRAVLDTPVLWILVSMFNLLRLRNGYSVASLKVFCIGANLAALAMEVVRFKMFGPFSLLAEGPIIGELIFSLVPKRKP